MTDHVRFIIEPTHDAPSEALFEDEPDLLPDVAACWPCEVPVPLVATGAIAVASYALSEHIASWALLNVQLPDVLWILVVASAVTYLIGSYGMARDRPYLAAATLAATFGVCRLLIAVTDMPLLTGVSIGFGAFGVYCIGASGSHDLTGELIVNRLPVLIDICLAVFFAEMLYGVVSL